MRKRRLLVYALLCALLLIAVVLIFAGRQLQEVQEAQATPAPTPTPAPRVGDVVEKEVLQQDPPLREDKSIYAADDDTSIVTMYLTVSMGNEYDSTNHTWAEVNTYDTYYYRDLRIPRYACEAILQVGDENGPLEGEFGFGEVIPNATVMVRGQTSSRNAQKNYKVRIKEGKGEWRSMRTLALNKYQSDPTRMKNKLVFDLIKDVPQMTAIRTQFVHLYVKDQTQKGKNARFEDYGLYTLNEPLNRRWLTNHGLDNKGYLYKVVNFEWYEYEPVMLPQTEADFDQDEFDLYLKAKGHMDHTKLQDLISVVNDGMIPITQIVDQYFDVENFSYYLAAQILTGNYDAGARNMYLYSPLNSEKWYFLSWDEDDTFTRKDYELDGYSDGGSWERGISQFSGIVLFQRIFREKEYRDALTAAIEDLKTNYMTFEEVNGRVQAYRQLIAPFINASPDVQYHRRYRSSYTKIMDAMASEIELNYQYYMESLEMPLPFYVGIPQIPPEGGVTINWEPAYDFDNETVTYTCILATKETFEEKYVLASAEGMRMPEVHFDVTLEPGTYFVRVQATNESGYTRDCFDYYNDSDIIDGKVYACLGVTVHEDMTVTAIENLE